MMARNSDVKGAVASILNVQDRFNDNFGYPWVFLNNEEWSEDFIDQVTEAVHLSNSGATARFELIPSNMWGYPSWVDKSKSQRNMQQLEDQGIMYAGKENYHHMCRFSSGFFYDIPASKSTSGTGASSPTSPSPVTSHTIPFTRWRGPTRSTAGSWRSGRLRPLCQLYSARSPNTRSWPVFQPPPVEVDADSDSRALALPLVVLLQQARVRRQR
uniref:Uncharacterized protein n=1 Tax=Bionectria ochroleuca TaxID=29856 RepID=A0A8H7K954_BIOOC